MEVAERRTLHAIEAAVLSTSGPIPAAEDLYGYSPAHQERILRMAEAPTTDESARRDLIVAARIEQSKRAQWVTPTMLFICIAAALVTFGAFENTVGGMAFLALPLLRFLGSYAVTFSMGGGSRRKKKR